MYNSSAVWLYKSTGIVYVRIKLRLHMHVYTYAYVTAGTIWSGSVKCM